MVEGGIDTILNILVALMWIVLDLAIAGVVFWRFRASATGLLVGIGHVLLVLKSFLSLFVFHVVFRVSYPDLDVHAIVLVVLRSITFFCYLLIAVGIGFIPRSLRKLSRPRLAG